MSFEESTKVITGVFWLMMSSIISLTDTSSLPVFKLALLYVVRLSFMFNLKSLMLESTVSIYSERVVKKRFWFNGFNL